MPIIAIGVGVVMAALAGFGLLESLPANIVLVIIGIILILYGSYEVFFKPRAFLQKRLEKWLLRRNWNIRIEKNPQFYFIIWAEDDSHREVMISRDKKDKGILAFTALIHKDKDKDLLSRLDRLADSQKGQLLEDIRIFFTSKDMGYGGAWWPLNKLSVQHALPLDYKLSEHLVDLKAKEVINAVIGVRSLIRKAVIPLELNKEGSQT
jgi:hypothetical protein